MRQGIFHKIRWQFILFLARHLPTCKAITPLISASLDKKLTLREKIVMKLHLFTCEACQHYAKQIRFMREIFQIQEEKVTKHDNTPKLSPEARQRMNAAINLYYKK